MGDEQSMNAIPTGVWVRRELVDALREALNEYPDATLYPTPEAFNVALMDTFKRAAQAARAVVDAVETEDKPKVPTTDLPDAVVDAAVEAFARKRNPKHNTLDHSETLAIRAALAAASGPWAEQLDAAKAEIRQLRAQIKAIQDELEGNPLT